MELLEQSLLLCMQGAAGSSPATSTNHFAFNRIASEFFWRTTYCLSRGWAVPINLLTSTN
jgi:hypothetical protein